MNKKTLLITLIALLVVLGIAGVLYPRLSAGMEPQQLATMPTETTQPATTGAAEATEEPTPPQTSVPEPVFAPDFTAVDWEGNQVALSDYLGKPLVLNFWAYWCNPCKMEMPEVNAVYEELGGEVTFLMVHADPDTESGKGIVTDAGYTFPVIFDEEGIAGMTYGIDAYPTTFFINAEGHLKAYYKGMMDEDLLRRGIDLLYE